MIYGGDKYGDIPVMKLFSEPIMQASIAAAKDLYDQGIKRADDNAKKYGDFFSPIPKDVDFWYNNTMQPVNRGLDWMARNGISPDSAEGRSIMSRIISNVPASQLATIRQSAEAGKQYQKNAAILRASGKYSQAFEDFVHGGKNLNNWDTSKDGAWTDTSPYEYETLSEYAGKPLEGIAEVSLTPDQAKSIFGSAYKPGHNYTGVTRDMAATAFANWEAGVAGTPLYDFYKYQTRQRLQKAGALDNLTKDQQDALVDKQFTKEALDATVKHWNKYHDLGMTDEAKAALQLQNDLTKQHDQQAFDKWKTQYTESQQNNRQSAALSAQLKLAGYTTDSNGNIVPASNNNQKLGYGAYDELEKIYATRAINDANDYQKHLASLRTNIGNRIRSIKNTTIRGRAYNAWNTILNELKSGKKSLYQISKDAHKFIDKHPGDKYSSSTNYVINDMFRYLWAGSGQKGSISDQFFSQRSGVPSRTNADGTTRSEHEIMRDVLSNFINRSVNNMGHYTSDMSPLNPIAINSNQQQILGDDVHYTGLIANGTMSNTGFKHNSITKQIDRALRGALASNGTTAYYGIGTINRFDSPFIVNHKGQRKRIAMGTQYVVLDNNASKAILDILQKNDQNASDYGITAVGDGVKIKIPVTKIAETTGPIRDSINQETYKRIGGQNLATQAMIPTQQVGLAYSVENY